MKTKYFAFAALATLLASCSNDEDFTPQVDSLKDTPITVSAMVGELATRAGYDSENLPGTFYLTVTQDTEDASSTYNYTNVEMTKGENNSYTPKTTMLWKDDAPAPSFISAYTIAGIEVEVNADQKETTAVAANDLLGALFTTETGSDITLNSGEISINFRHLLCKLDITLSWGTELDNAKTKEITGVTIGGLNTTATLDRTTATVSTDDNETVADIAAYVSTTTAGYTAEAIFAPSTANPTITISTKIDNVERVFSLTPNAPEDGFTSGNCYTVNVTVGGTAVETLSAVSATGWGDPNESGNMATN